MTDLQRLCEDPCVLLPQYGNAAVEEDSLLAVGVDEMLEEFLALCGIGSSDASAGELPGGAPHDVESVGEPLVDCAGEPTGRSGGSGSGENGVRGVGVGRSVELSTGCSQAAGETRVERPASGLLVEDAASIIVNDVDAREIDSDSDMPLPLASSTDSECGADRAKILDSDAESTTSNSNSDDVVDFILRFGQLFGGAVGMAGEDIETEAPPLQGTRGAIAPGRRALSAHRSQ